MTNKTVAVGVIVLGANMDDEVLMVENEGLYSFPEISVEASNRNNIVDTAYDLTKKMNIKAEELTLVYVIEQKIPERDEVLVTYYFVTMAENNDDIPKAYEWVSKVYNKLDTSIYPQEFIDSLTKKWTEGWKVVTEVIK